jgi:hypothetical protein
MAGLRKNKAKPTNKQLGLRICTATPDDRIELFWKDLRAFFIEARHGVTKEILLRHPKANDILEALPQ